MQADVSWEDTLGGLLFGYTPSEVRVWMPSPIGQANPTMAALITTGMSGWGQGSSVSSAPYLTGQLRVMAWREDQVPDFESPWTSIVSCSSLAYLEIRHGLGRLSWCPACSVTLTLLWLRLAAVLMFPMVKRRGVCMGRSHPGSCEPASGGELQHAASEWACV